MKSISLKNTQISSFISDNFKDLKLLLFWPLYGAAFMFLERGPDRSWFIVECGFDNIIPFCEFFIFPYFFWFVYIIFMHSYSFFYDRPTYVKYMKYTIITYTTTILIYVLFPTAQELRPDLAALGRENILTKFLTYFYMFDTNTNVCPSLHVTGSVAVWIAAWKSKHFSTPLWRTVFTVITILICVSTVFLKQHSIIDAFFAFALCAIVYVVVYIKKEKKS